MTICQCNYKGYCICGKLKYNIQYTPLKIPAQHDASVRSEHKLPDRESMYLGDTLYSGFTPEELGIVVRSHLSLQSIKPQMPKKPNPKPKKKKQL